MSKNTYRTADDVTMRLDVPVLGVVPAMLTPDERRQLRHRRRIRLIAVATAAAIFLATVAWLVLR